MTVGLMTGTDLVLKLGQSYNNKGFQEIEQV